MILPDCKIIYISYSVESEIRKKYSNQFIYFLTKFLENLVFKLSKNYSTAVSVKEKNKILKFYKRKQKFIPMLSINSRKKYKKFKNFTCYLLWIYFL